MTLQQIVQTAANLYPARTAVCFDECNNESPATYTYKTVTTLATELTDFLREKCNLTESSAIGLYCYPGINLPSWIIGILQVPAAYSPVDPDALPALSTYIIKKCDFKYVLVEKDKRDKFRVTFGHLFCHNFLEIQHVGLILFQRNSSSIDVNLLTGRENDDNERPAVTSCWEENTLQQNETKQSKELLDVRKKHSLAYVLHTSGTTGIPKIVRVPHRCIVPNILHLQDLFQITPDDVIFMASPLTFDPSVVELFVTLASGASLLIVPHLIKMIPQDLSEALFQRHRVSVLQATPTLLRRFGIQCIMSTVLSASTSLRVLALGGEAFPGLNVLRSWKEKGNRTQVFNLYGITEVSCWATCYKIPEALLGSDHRFDSIVPLGTPLSGTRVEVRDSSGSAILEGEGQVFIGEKVVGFNPLSFLLGFVERQILIFLNALSDMKVKLPVFAHYCNKKAFYKNDIRQVLWLEGGEERVCFLDDEVTLPRGTMRATGDFVRVKGTEMFYLGRKDHQIKRHGKKLNTAYIQQLAEDNCHVEASAVIWYQQEKLILFVVPKGSFKQGDLFRKLQECLPSHAVPDELLLIDSLPSTSHGKIDVSELNKIYSNHLNSRRCERKLNTKEELWERLQWFWKSLLNLPDDSTSISEDSLFLNSGGDSLKSLHLHDEIVNLVGRAIPGLLEVILSCSIAEVYKHVLKTAFPSEDQKLSCSSSAKRKWRDESGEEASIKYLEPKAGVSLKSEAHTVGFVAVSRGNRLLFTDEHLKNQYDAGIQLRESMPSSLVVSEDRENEVLKSNETIASDANPTEVDSVQPTPLKENLGRIAGKLTLDVRWKSDLGKCVDASPLVVIPVIDQLSASVYIGSHSHAIQAVDLYSGRMKWERYLADRIESSACVSTCGNFIIVGCYNGLVYVLRSSSGEIHWTFVTEDAVKSCAVMDPSTGLVFVGSHDQHVYALDIYVMGTPIWKNVCGKPVFSSPHCNKDCVCVGCVDGNFYCFSHLGEKVWQFSTNGPIFSSPCISTFATEIFFGSHDHFTYCCNMEGNLMWKFETTSTVYATPFVFHSCHLEDKTLLAVISTDGRIWILNAKTGGVEGSGKLPGEVFSSPVVWGTKLVVGCRNNYVYCLDLCISKNSKTA